MNDAASFALTVGITGLLCCCSAYLLYRNTRQGKKDLRERVRELDVSGMSRFELTARLGPPLSEIRTDNGFLLEWQDIRYSVCIGFDCWGIAQEVHYETQI